MYNLCRSYTYCISYTSKCVCENIDNDDDDNINDNNDNDDADDIIHRLGRLHSIEYSIFLHIIQVYIDLQFVAYRDY